VLLGERSLERLADCYTLLSLNTTLSVYCTLLVTSTS
jgi:hypothetical protein